MQKESKFTRILLSNNKILFYGCKCDITQCCFQLIVILYSYLISRSYIAEQRREESNNVRSVKITNEITGESSICQCCTRKGS